MEVGTNYRWRLVVLQQTVAREAHIMSARKPAQLVRVLVFAAATSASVICLGAGQDRKPEVEGVRLGNFAFEAGYEPRLQGVCSGVLPKSWTDEEQTTIQTALNDISATELGVAILRFVKTRDVPKLMRYGRIAPEVETASGHANRSHNGHVSNHEQRTGDPCFESFASSQPSEACRGVAPRFALRRGLEAVVKPGW